MELEEWREQRKEAERQREEAESQRQYKREKEERYFHRQKELVKARDENEFKVREMERRAQLFELRYLNLTLSSVSVSDLWILWQLIEFLRLYSQPVEFIGTKEWTGVTGTEKSKHSKDHHTTKTTNCAIGCAMSSCGMAQYKSNDLFIGWPKVTHRYYIVSELRHKTSELWPVWPWPLVVLNL